MSGQAISGGVPGRGQLAVPPPGEVHVFWARSDLTEARLAELRGAIDSAQLELIDRHRQPADRARGTAAHALLRLIAAAMLDRDPATITLSRTCEHCGDTNHGKPRLALLSGENTSPLSFNLSHSGEVVALAVAGPAVEIGVDVEAIRPDYDWSRVRRHVLTDPEWEQTAATPQPATARFQLWASKEASLKATGHGVTVEMASVTFAPTANGWSPARSPATTAPILSMPVPLDPSVAAAVAVSAITPPTLTTHRVSLVG